MLFPDSITHIIMVSYFRPNDFRLSVESVLTNTHCPFHLSIIDNSHGGLNEVLTAYENHSHITICRNNKNVGKSVAFKQWYAKIMANNEMPYFISIDADIVVPNGWLTQFKMLYNTIANHDKPGIIAPTIIEHPSDTFEKQMETGQFQMHSNEFRKTKYHPDLYLNHKIAGPLFMIDSAFFENVGGYYKCQQNSVGGTRLYGADDAGLCKAAIKDSRFVGVTRGIKVIHCKEDDTDGYRLWKLRNVTKDVDHRGFWDQSDNQNNNDQ